MLHTLLKAAILMSFVLFGAKILIFLFTLTVKTSP